MKRSVLALLMSIALIMMLLGGCGTTEEPVVTPTEPAVDDPVIESKIGGEMVYGFTGDPATLNPILSTDAMSGFTIGLIHSGLLRSNENMELIGDLAHDAWEVSADNLTLTFRIRDNVYWHDGEKLTAHDIKFTYDAIMHPDYDGVRARNFRAVEEVVVPDGDDYTLILQLNRPDAALLSFLTIGILPQHIMGDVPVAEFREHPNSRMPVGTGPYMMHEFRSGQYIVLERNPNYFWPNDEPYIERIRIRVYEDTQVILSALEAGDIDWLGSIPVDDIEYITTTYDHMYDFAELQQNGYWYIGMKQDHPIFSDKRVRKALTYGLDREGIVENLFEGYGTVVHADKPPVSWAYNPNLYTYDYNPQKAVELLEEAGWNIVGDDGIRRNAAGDRLEFNLISASGDATRDNMLDMIRNYWRQIGIDMSIELFEISVYYGKLDNGEFEIYQWGWNLGLDPDNFIFFHSSSGFDENGVLQGFNDVGFANDRVDELIEMARESFDQDFRRQCYFEIQEILNEELPYVFLYNRNNVGAVNKNVKGIVWGETAAYFRESWWIEER